MKVWKRITYYTMIVWGAKSLIIGFSGYSFTRVILSDAMPESLLELIEPLLGGIGIWGAVLFTIGLTIYLYERNRAKIER